MTSIMNPKRDTPDLENATSQDQSANAILYVESAHTLAELNQTLKVLEKRATDLINLDVVREGYLSHGHPASLGFQHLNTMTNSRIKKRIPLFDKTDPVMRILWVKTREIVGEEIVNKYKARREGKSYNYMKAIDKRIAVLFNDIEKYKDVVRELEYAESRD